VNQQDYSTQEHIMKRTYLASAAAAGLLALLTASQAHAYGACHSGYTTVSPTGQVQHYGTTSGYGPNGAGTVSHSGSYTPGGGYEGTTTATGAYGGSASVSRAYSPGMYGGYSAAGTATGAYGNSVTRSATYYP
jgi:hypothetical protein